MIEWRVYKGDRPSPTLKFMQVFIEDWKRENPSHSHLDGLELLEVMGLLPLPKEKYRLERVEVPWEDYNHSKLEELNTIAKPPTRQERRRVEKEYLKGLKKKGTPLQQFTQDYSRGVISQENTKKIIEEVACDCEGGRCEGDHSIGYGLFD